MRLFALVLSTFFTTLCWNLKSQDYVAPLDIPLVLSGNFGEIRGNHFHTGLDIKTQGRSGLSVKSIAKGSVARVKVSAYGYGNALYINHPDGKTSVYAHLSEFHPEIEKWVKEQQYKKESFEIDLFPPAGKFSFEAGEEIAKSGNSGSSGGPHLHFEIRDTKTEEPINPQKFGFKIDDTVQPSVYGLSLYALNDNSHVNQKAYDNFSMGGTYGNYALKPGESITAHGEIGIAVHSIDRYNAANNKCGVYKLTLNIDGVSVYQATFDRLNFATNRYINAHIDYNSYKRYKKHYHRLFKVENNRLNIYNTLVKNGVIACNKDQLIKCEVLVEDFMGNKSVLLFDINAEAKPYLRVKSAKPGDQWVNCTRPFEWKSENASVSIPENCLYFSDDLNFSAGETNGFPSIAIADAYTAAQTAFTINLKIPDSLASNLHDKIYLGKVAANGRVYADNPGKVVNGWFIAQNREFGEYSMLIDTITPNIKPIGFWNGKELRNGNTIRFRIDDSGSGINSYRLSIDDNWALGTYDYRRKSVEYVFDATRVKAGDHKLKMEVTDKVGNVELYEATFKSY